VRSPFSEEKLLNHENQAATVHPHFLDGGDWIGREELKHFHKLTAPVLKACIHSRTFTTVRPPQVSGIRWKRGQNSAHNGMGVLECLQKTIILQATAHAYQDTNHPVNYHFHASSHHRCACQSVSDDQMIVDAGWVATVEAAFVSLVSSDHSHLAHTPDDAARADHLQAILTHRLYVHVNTRKHTCT